MHFEPTRDDALRRLKDFLPHAGRDYAARRNYDLPGHADVSRLSPHIRHRLISEEEVVQAVLSRHSLKAAEKYVQEVFWRTYWKGWLELRPTVWTQYQAELQACLNRVQTEAGLRRAWEDACTGNTGIEAFDHWARELTVSGYLHNHARMWFASIWVFTLGLPWQLGADFFLRHLLDGDAASNTLSWRWVAGIQTRGKTYLARADNIAKYTEGRFHPEGLADIAPPVDAPPAPPAGAVPVSDSWDPAMRTGFLLHEDDLSPAWLLDQIPAPAATLALTATQHRSPLAPSDQVVAFTDDAMTDTIARHEARLGMVAYNVDPLSWAHENGVEQIVTSYAPVGPMGERIAGLKAAGLPVVQVLRDFDAAAWPHATHGFFKFKDKIPKLVGRMRGLSAA